MLQIDRDEILNREFVLDDENVRCYAGAGSIRKPFYERFVTEMLQTKF